MPRHLDPAVESAIRAALADPAASYASIAAEVGCDKSTVRERAIRLGMKRNPRDFTEDQQAKVLRMLRAGTWTYQQIADGVGCSRGHVQETARKLGINREDQRFGWTRGTP
jgi:DNA invertase Pin-like site-specific DNA recombinase